VFLKYGFSFLKHGSLWVYRFATWAVLVCGLGFALGVVLLRYLLLPNIDSYHQSIAQAVSGAVGQQVSIGRIEGSWRGYRPELRLFDVEVHEPGGQVALELDRVDTVLSWVSLLAGEVNFHALEISRAVVEVRRDSLGVLWVAGDPVDVGGGKGGLRNWLMKQRQIVVRDATVVWIDEMRAVRPLVIENAQLRIDNEAGRHRFGLTGRPPVELASAISLRGDFAGDDLGDLSTWRGRLYGEFEYANVALATTWVPLPLLVESGLGSLRLWVDVADARIASATADVNLVNVRSRLRPELPRLDLGRLSGRIGWHRDALGSGVSGRSLALQLPDGRALPPFGFSLRRDAGAPARYELTLVSLELAPYSRLLPFLPLGAGVQARIASAQPAGRLPRARVAWRSEGEAVAFESADIAFESLAMQASGRLPGVRGISGALSADDRGGRLTLKGEKGSVELPMLFAVPIPLDFLAAEADWAVDGDRLAVNVRSASFTNSHAAGSASGSYRSAAEGPGSVDIKAQLVRGEAKDVWRYVPNAAQTTRAWLERALVAGRIADANLTLSGPLQAFPFAGGKGGRFEVVARMEGVRLDYARGWPALEGVSGDLAFRGDTMKISASAGRILDVDVAGTRADIGELGAGAERLQLAGEARGPVSGFLRFVADSPVSGYVGRFPDRMSADGSGRLTLKLDLPLHKTADVAMVGRFSGSGTRLRVDPRVPDLADYTLALGFSERELKIEEGRARFLGGPLRIDGGTRKGGGFEINLGGTVAVAELARRFAHPAWRGVEGSGEWRGRLTVQNQSARLSLQSALQGVGSRLPAPLDKASAATLPLKIDWSELAPGQQELALSLGERVAARLILDGEGVRRGGIGFGAAAELPLQDGLNIVGRLAVLDVDAWRSVLDDGPAAAAPGDRRADAGPGLAGIDLAIGALDVNGRRFSDLRIAGRRADDGWRVALEGKQGKGEAMWAPAQGGRLSARFLRLAIPRQASSLVPVATAGTQPALLETLPGLDVMAEEFSFEGKPLGRLELLADRRPGRWHLERLALANPDGRLDVSGDWITTGRPHTDLQVRVEASNVGQFLARLGYPEEIKGGTGSLAGPLTWIGAPYRPDLPTLSGRLKLEAKDGRFADLEPGAAKLLGILSLQSLPRRLSFDFRDLFSSGFSFETIEANVALANGVAQTSDFLMAGSAARVQMKGQVSLAAETQDLQVRVLPQLSTAAAVAGAVVNPAIGVATLVLQKALGDPVEEMAARNYHVTGSWTEPVVTRVGRENAPSNQRK
jgi:uncharacterized protein (TIGR02099 family)